MAKFLTTNGINYVVEEIIKTAKERVALVLAFLFVVIPSSARAGIGETALQFADRYGPPKDTSLTQITDKNSPLVEGGIHHTYEYHGWKIRAAFLQLDGPCVRMEYQKLPTSGVNPRIQDYELQAIAAGNTPTGMTWKRVMYDNPDSPNKGLSKLAEAYFAGVSGQKMWQRSDGAILWLRINLIVRLELPAAGEYEAQLKVAKDRQARVSVPEF
jgi:hypothetical protein